MTKIKLCGLKRACDITWANELQLDYVGLVFAKDSRRYVMPKEAAGLKTMLSPSIQAVGVFVNEDTDTIAGLAGRGIIDAVQLHGKEDERYIRKLREQINIPIVQAFRIRSGEDVKMAERSLADMVLLDAGAGCGEVFDWNLLKEIRRPYFLAGGLTSENVSEAMRILQPFAVDVSSSLETEGVKDGKKMTAFVEAVRRKDEIE